MKRLAHLAAAALITLTGGCASRVGAPPDIPRAPPAPATSVRACWVEFGSSAGFTASGIVVHHPRGTVLIDAGQSRRFFDEIQDPSVDAKPYLRFVPGALVGDAPASSVLERAGVDPHKLTWFIPTHVHSDHVGGLMDLPDVPILLERGEIGWLSRSLNQGVDSRPFNVIPAHARRMMGHVKEAVFEPTPYEVFGTRYDVFGDGAIVLVPLRGHTPGSVGVFVNAGETRLFDVGDAVNEVAAIESLRGKAFYLARTDADPERADAVVAELAALRRQDPSLRILPAHERRTWEAIFSRPFGCIGR